MLPTLLLAFSRYADFRVPARPLAADGGGLLLPLLRRSKMLIARMVLLSPPMDSRFQDVAAPPDSDTMISTTARPAAPLLTPRCHGDSHAAAAADTRRFFL